MQLTDFGPAEIIAAADPLAILQQIWFYVQIFIGFSFIIFVHELGHFWAAKWADVRVEQFAVGFFREVVGFTRGETRYSFNLLPLGGYVKMVGQEDFELDSSGEMQRSDDPRSFINKTVFQRMVIVSGGVVMNLVLAGLLFMIVFMVGKRVQSPKVGMVMPDSPAARAGLMPGDVIRRINGDDIDEFNEISMSVMLAKPGQPLDIQVERDGEVLHMPMEPEQSAENGRFQIGVTSAQSSVLVGIGPEYDQNDPHDPRFADRIVALRPDGDLPVTDDNANQMMDLLFTHPLEYPRVVVERPEDPLDEATPTERVEVNLQPRLALRQADLSGEARHLLGLVPLMRFSSVEEGGRADLAGIEVGDVILKWGPIDNPTPKQIEENLVASAPKDDPYPENDIPLRLRKAKDGREVAVVVRPKVKQFPITGRRSKPTIGASLQMFADDWLRVGSIVEEAAGLPTSALTAGIPTNAMIDRVNDVPVRNWLELAEQFRAHAGDTVTVHYRLDGAAQSADMAIPQSVRTKLGLSPGSLILSIDGTKMVEVDHRGRSAKVSVQHLIGLSAALREHVGETIEVMYRPSRTAEAQTASVTVTEAMVYPWVGSLDYTFNLACGGETMILRKSSPLAALNVGIKKTYYFVVQVYQVMERMIISRSLGVENISGPVGIVKLGGQMAQAGIIQLFYFLAIISANLAVINFMPLPVFDGGHMVFLIIEWIKGSPVSVRIQVATQVLGIVLIGAAFLFVTIQDIVR